MRLKQFLFAFVAMLLSFSVSSFAQTTVTTEDELRTAMSSSGAVVLGNDIEVKSVIEIPKKMSITLDLNGKSIKGVTSGQILIQLLANAQLTINDSKGGGSLTGLSYVLHCAGGSKVTLNAGKIYRSGAWAVYTTGVFTVNGGSVETPENSMAIRVAGSGTVQLNGGTVTSVQVSAGTLNVADEDVTITSGIQLDKGAKDVNITAGTVNGTMTVAPEVTADKITVSGGTFENPDAVSDYLEEGLTILDNGQVVAGMFKIGDTYYPTLAEAFKAAENGDVVSLLSDITIDSETYTIADGVAVTLDMNGKKITVTDNKTSNYELFYIYGEMTVTGNGTIELTATNDRDWNAMSAIFHNRGGVLTVENGTFKHLGGTDMAYVIDNSGNYYGDATTNVKGGTLTSSYIGIRNRMEQNSHGASGTAYLNVSGGTINGTSRAIWAQAASVSETAPATGAINVSGGEVGLIDTPRGTGAVSMTTITGGTVASFKGEAGELTVKGGSITGEVTILSAAGEPVEYVVTENGLYATAAAKIGEKCYRTFAEAMAAANATTGEVTVEVLAAVEFVNGMELNGNYTTINFVGKNADAKMTINQTAGGDYLTAHGKNVNFTDLTLAKANPAWSGNSSHMGNYFSVQGGTATYTNCIFLNGACTSGGTATYDGCTFQNDKEYGLWAYDDAIVTVNGGTIDSKKGIKVYSEDEASVTTTLTVENAIFTEKVTDKPAVAVGYAASITLKGNTYNNPTADVELDSGSDADCEGVTFVAQDASGNDISATITAVDRSNSNAACGVLVDGKIYTTVAEAAKEAVAGSTVTLLYSSAETVALPMDVILNTNGHTAEGVTVIQPIATINGTKYASLQAAVNAVKNGETITLVNDCGENVTVVQAPDVKITIDGAEKTYTGTITVDGKSAAYETAGLTVKNLNFIAATNAVCIHLGVEKNNNTRYTSNVTVDACTFTGTDNTAAGIKSYTGGDKNLTVTNCTATKMHSLMQLKNVAGVNVANCTIVEGKNGISLGVSSGVAITSTTMDCEGYGLRADANATADATVTDCKIEAFIPVVVRSASAEYALEFTGTNTMTATNEDGLWCAIGTSEYEENGKMPTAATAHVNVTLKDAGLSLDGIYGYIIGGKGTAEAPYLINNVNDFVTFRNSVNNGETTYNAAGVCIALGADIDLNNEEWTPIGNVTYNSKYVPADASKVFKGVFNGNGKTISNLKVTSTVGGADTQANVGLFGITGEGAVIKDLTLTNVNIETDGRNVGALAGFAYKATLSNITVKGDIKIKGGNNVAGVAGMTRYYAMSATNISVIGNEGSAIVGNNIVGGIFAEISPNGSEQKFDGLKVENVAITGASGVGGIVGLLTTGAVENVSVKDVVLTGRTDYQGNAMGRIRLGSVAGLMGSKYATIANETVENVTAKNLDGNAVELSVIGANYDASSNATEAKIGNTYYNTFATAYAAAKAGETVTLLVDLNMSDILTINKAITLDGNGKTLTSTAGRAINIETEGEVTIKNLTVNANGERAFNVINKPATLKLEGVTATAKNYAVMIATSAGAAKVTIDGSELTGLNVVNVAGAASEVAIKNNSKIINVDANANETYGAISIYQTAVNAKVTVENSEIVVADDSKKGYIFAEGATITGVDQVGQVVAMIGDGGYETLAEAIADAKAGQTVKVVCDVTMSEILVIDKAITLDGNGKTLTSTAGRAINVSGADGVTIKNLTISASGERAINVIQNATNVTIEKVTATAANYTVNVASSAPNAKVAIKGSTLTGLNVVNVAAEGADVTVEGGKITCNDQNDAEGYAALSLNKDAKNGKITATGVTFDIKGDSDKASNGAEGGVITIDGSTDGVAVDVAYISYGSNYYGFKTIADAVAKAKDGETIVLINNVTSSDVININKSITIDGNGKAVNYTGTDRAFQITGGTVVINDLTVNMPETTPEGSRGINLYNGATNAAIDVTLNNVTVNGYKAYAVNIGGGKDNKLAINGSNLTGYAAINVNQASVNHTIVVDGSTLNGKNHNNGFDFGAVVVDGTNAHSLTITNTTITTENLEGVTTNYEQVVVGANCTLNWDGGSATVRNIIVDGLYYTDLKTAVEEAAEKSATVKILGNISIAEMITVPAGKKVVLDLNGKTITGTDNTSKNFSIIDNRGNLIIKDSSAEKSGKITLTATTNSGWTRYSAVIANNPGGKLTVEGGTIEHLGGTDMAYGIDNLTNGKGTYAETIINGGTVKSTYRAVRQFLNGVEAQNILTVNGGTIEGANKSVWMHDPSAKANTGTLNVGENAKLNGDVYLFVTAGSTEWPVSVSIAAAALQGESKVTTANVPAGYDLAEVDGTYGVFSGAAKIGETYYATIAEAVADAKAGDVVTILADAEATDVILLSKSITINGNGHKVKSSATRVFRVTTSNTEVTLNDVNMVSTAVRVGTNDVRGISIDASLNNVKLTLNNSSVDFTDASACDWAYAVNVAGNGTGHAVTVNGGTYEGANVINVHGANNTIIVKNATLNCLYPNNDMYMGACLWVLEEQNSSVEAIGNTFNGDNAYAFNVGTGTSLVESENIDNTKYVVAKIGDAYYTSIQEAVDAAKTGDVVRLIQNVTMDTKNLVAECDGYSSLVHVQGKAITIDLNGKAIVANAYAEELAGVKGKMLLGVFSTDEAGKLTLVDSKGTATVTLNANDATVYSLLCSYEGGCQIKVEGGTYVADKVSDSMIYGGGSDGQTDIVVINGGNFTLGNVGEGQNGKPWIFNTYGKNANRAVVNGGTFNADVNHLFWANEVFVPETKALKDNGNGTWTVVDAVAYTTERATSTSAYDRKVGYATVEEAMAATNKYNCIDNTVVLVKNLEIESSIPVPSDVEVVLDLNGKKITPANDQVNLDIYGKLTINDATGEGVSTFRNHFVHEGAEIVVNGGTIQNIATATGGFPINLTEANAKATINGGTVQALNGEAGTGKNGNYAISVSATSSVTVNGGTINGKWGGINSQGNVTITDGTFNVTDAIGGHCVYVGGGTATISGGTFTPNTVAYSYSVYATGGATTISGGNFGGGASNNSCVLGIGEETTATISVSGGTFAKDVNAFCAAGYIAKQNAEGKYEVVVDPKHGMVAQIGEGEYFENQYFATITEAAQAAQTGDVIKLIADVEMTTANYATITDGYAVLVPVAEKTITFDLNGKNITVNAAAADLANAEGKMLMSVFGIDTNGNLTLTGEGSVKVVANDANVYSMAAAYGEGAHLTVDGGNYEIDVVGASGSLIYAQHTECITVNAGDFRLGNVGTGANGSPWIFNTKGQNYTGVIVNGGTFPTDINHQFWANETFVPVTKALKDNGDGTWTVVDAAVYTTEKATSRGSYSRNVGYASIEDAIAATNKYNCENNTVTLIKDLAIEKMITVANGTTVVLDLAGKTLAATDNTSKNYSAIDNRGDLTITDSSEERTGKITVTATVNSGWNRYSAVIANNPGGKLTVEAGIIEHLGGTDMVYGIDNLTNGKGTYAETIINGGLVKSPYRAVRQFLNGIEAQNILTVNGGTLNGANKSIFFHDPSTKANSGTLYVGEGAQLNGDVYLFVTEGSTEWPVEVEVAKAALAGASTVTYKNVPEEAAAVLEYATCWTVEQKNLAELTIEDDYYAEYVNLIEKNVGTLTYERDFTDTEWQTLYLPYEVPVSSLTAAGLEVAYIYNASYKNSEATIDYVVIDENSVINTLSANYPYLVRAAETGYKSVVVTDAKLMPTVVNTIDCSSVFEKFVFAGNYNTVAADTLDATKGYFDLNAGTWSRMDEINPFRVYMQIELRDNNGGSFVYPASDSAIRMRQVGPNGNATGIGGVSVDGGADYIFDIQGRRVAQPEKGRIYIVNGTKVLY